jgi:cyclic beta-1,2-glucan synthetase
MPQNRHLEIISAEAERIPDLRQVAPNFEAVNRKAKEAAFTFTFLPGIDFSHTFQERCASLTRALKPLLRALESSRPKPPISDDLVWLYDSPRLLVTALQDTAGALKRRTKLAHVRAANAMVLPRILALADTFLAAAGYQFSETEFTSFFDVYQQHTVLELRELWALAPAMKLVLLERIAERGAQLLREPHIESLEVGICVRSLRDIGQTTWKDIIEPLIVFDQVLRQDPAGCYAEMDFESRDFFRNKLSNISDHSSYTELEIAQAVLALAKEAGHRCYADLRVAQRERHVGYYLVDKGVSALQHRVGFRPPLGQRVQALLRRSPDECYLLGIGFVMLVTVLFVISLVPVRSLGAFLLAIMALLLPSSQSAVQLINHIVTSLLPPEILPKLDFSEGVPSDCTTMVAVPCLLLNEEQVQGLVEDLEVRFLGNHDANIHFALLTDLPDTPEPTREDSPLVSLCVDLIQELNEKYWGQGMGGFFLFHRHRIYNPREKTWMGWERKRGKLLDLNNLLCGQYDSFPVKAGDLSILGRVRFVITLDADTELPRGTAQRMIGALAHPLNQAIIDSEKNAVVAGYGILQPRVGVSVRSTARSRLAAIYAGETGLDIYTRAVSDAYQDLYGEGSFTGKGIYEAAILHRVLHGRFPQNALLSHDLVEGAYARAGLVSDIEVIEDYPSHYSAYNRRKHRWLRGDWQTSGWLLPRVLEESGKRTPNPITLISRWKILDNLRRSLVEPATFSLLLLGWIALDGAAWHWTLATLGLLLLPACFQFAVGLLRSAIALDVLAAREALDAFLTASANVFFALTLLAHQTLLSLDAVVRTFVRRVITHSRLLEWETAAETEMGGRRRAPVDIYLNWTPALSLLLGLLVLVARPEALTAALPILALWASSAFISTWLNKPPATPVKQVHRKDVSFLRRASLRTWRYFAEFSTEEHNWLVPDNVQEHPPAVAARVSPTNLGLLLNARQAACEFGYLTVPEFVDQTMLTLATLSALKKYRGHMLNWYDTRTLQPLVPHFVSSVDSGNLMASLWTLQQGCSDRLRQPLLQRSLQEGLLDSVRMLVDLGMFPPKLLSSCERQFTTDTWLQSILELPEEVFDQARYAISKSRQAAGEEWFANEACSRLRNIKEMVRDYAPWTAPEFLVLRDIGVTMQVMDSIALEQLPDFVDRLAKQLDLTAHSSISLERKALCERLREKLPTARANILRLVRGLQKIAADSAEQANAMDFSFLLNRRRKLMSVGFDVNAQRLDPSCYDLLGTESRTALFVAIAKEDIPQECWFLLGRAHTLDRGRPILLSWTGTLFEYLMPALWMHSYPNTLLERSCSAAVRSQQAYARAKRIPWGISESAHFKFDDNGNYQYHAFGLFHLGLRRSELDAVVVSPYSTFLALNVDSRNALRNLRRMAKLGWIGEYGFYEAADYGSVGRTFWRPKHQLVRGWMAHHQGMTLLALANFLNGNVVQKWFHSERRVQATALLLHEKPIARIRRTDARLRPAAA